MDYATKNHAKFLMLYHIIFVCKYRKNLLLRYGGVLNQIFTQIATTADFSFEAMEVDRDHIHCLVKSEPKISPLSIVRKLKQQSTFRLWQMYETDLKRECWKERTFWSDGYFCCMIGNASQETIRSYIASQG
jgi:REP-associated tyrosine transposase